MTCFQDILSFIGPHNILRSWEWNKKLICHLLELLCYTVIILPRGREEKGENRGIECPMEATKHFVGMRFEE